MNDIPYPSSGMGGLSTTLEPYGTLFRDLVEQITTRTGHQRLSSFRTTYQAPDGAIVVSSVSANPAFDPQYMTREIGPLDDLPDAVRLWQPVPAPQPQVTFDTTGMTLRRADTDQRFAAPPDVHPIRFPMSAVYDAQHETLYGLTLGGEGRIYRVDAATGRWSVLTSLGQYDGAHMMFDTVAQRLVITGAFERPGEVRIVELDGTTRGFTRIVTDFVGLTDLFNYGYDHPPSLTPKLIDGDWVVVNADAPDRTGPYRAYALNLETADIRLLAYNND